MCRSQRGNLKDRQFNSQKKRERIFNNCAQNITQKTEDRVTQTPLQTGGKFPAFTVFAISCHVLFLPPEVIDEENFAFKITFLFSCSSNNTTFSLCPIWLPLRHFLFSTVTNSNIQTHPTLNVYPHKVIKACINLFIEKFKRHYQGWVDIILNGKWRRVPIIST